MGRKEREGRAVSGSQGQKAGHRGCAVQHKATSRVLLAVDRTRQGVLALTPLAGGFGRCGNTREG
jgi:hypothetical protein